MVYRGVLYFSRCSIVYHGVQSRLWCYSGWSTGEFYISVNILLFTLVFSLVYGAILDGLPGSFIFQLMFFCLPWCSVSFMVLFWMVYRGVLLWEKEA